jgi:predicted GH43/DUF377 family glycosyl hydrolase
MYDPNGYKPIPIGIVGGWEKPVNRPIFDPGMGFSYDNYVIKEGTLFKMWFSWRASRGIVYVTSTNGIEWTLPQVALSRLPGSMWEDGHVSRPTLIHKDGKYHMWYTGHHWSIPVRCSIGYAVSEDGIHWERPFTSPVMSADLPWERHIIVCPHVIYDSQKGIYKMWYAGGATDHSECDAIGYAESKDGFHWIKDGRNPIFTADRNHEWESYKVCAPYVWQRDGWYYMAYIGCSSDAHDYNGLARSRDGITGWERHPSNPIIAGSEGSWDCNSICKLTVIEIEDGYMGWYNGVNNKMEELGVIVHRGFDLGFPEPGKPGKNERGDVSFLPPINTVV